MIGSTTARRRRAVPGPAPRRFLHLWVGLLLSLTVAAAGSPTWATPASPGSAGSSVSTRPVEQRPAGQHAAEQHTAEQHTAGQRAERLRITDIDVSCECGGVGYLWGWRVVSVGFDGGREGYRYELRVKGGPTVPAQWGGYASMTQEQGGFEYGKPYRFRVTELKRGQVTRATDWRRFRIPRPVGHPSYGGLETVTLGDQEVLVAGRTHRITFEGEWAEGVRFASGVDWFRGTAEGDDRFGYYEEEDYPLPFRIGTEAPILELTPTEEYAGTTWSVLVVGYRPAAKANRAEGIKKGDPVPGSEWGWSFSVPVVSADEVPAD